MTSELLKELSQYLYDNLVQGDIKYFNDVIILDNNTFDRIKVHQYPLLVVNYIGQNQRQGRFVNTNTIVKTIKIQIISFTIDPEAYLVGDPGYTPITDLTEIIRLLLYQNKKLTSDTFAITDRFDINQIPFPFGEESGGLAAMDIFVDYEFLEEFTGGQNNQESLETPDLKIESYQF